MTNIVFLVKDEQGKTHPMILEEARANGWTHERISAGHCELVMAPRKVGYGQLVPSTYPGRKW